jgi:hypothetical protein
MDLQNELLEHPSLTDSVLRSFEQNQNPNPRDRSNSPGSFGYPSRHSPSGFRSETTSERGSSPSPSRFNPPAWTRGAEEPRAAGGFYNNPSRNLGYVGSRQGTPYGSSPYSSRHGSPEYESDGENMQALAARTRLPSGSLSPEKFRSVSPTPYHAPVLRNVEFANPLGAGINQVEEHPRENCKKAVPSPLYQVC